MMGCASLIIGSVLECRFVVEPHRLLAAIGWCDTGGAVGRNPLTDPCEHTVVGHLGLQLPAAKVADQPIEVVVAHAMEVAVVDLEAGGFGARRDALVTLEGEHAVGGGPSGLHTERILGVG